MTILKEKEKREESPNKGKWIKMNFDHGGYKKGDEFYYENAPFAVKRWADLPGRLGEALVVTVSDGKPPEKEIHTPYVCEKCGHVEGQPLEKKKTAAELNQEKINAAEKQDRADTTVFCKGVKADGSPCNRTKLVKGTDFCFQHPPR